ncbi:transcriptional regulator GcvA [Ramlibacter sp.]|uniref:transcriptional regulator GcvA n=1 Tax=Ramlibacter sp. TaxID=1917967 RepID=UPI0017B775E1|nr:transcriptional regulator GcvA [Ramlibacter sp.]MBA2676015.1 transcriptional regulator GcvA [Ramlibacter sp.]
MLRLPPLAAVRAFEAAARHASFSRAGEELCVSPGAVGHQVRQLEDWLGVMLFARGPRSVALTEAGRRYFGEVRELLQELERASLALKDHGASDEVTVTAMPSFVTRWLMPRLGSFREQHPAVEVRLLASVPPVDFAAERVDVAIRLGTGPYAGLEAAPLLRETYWPVCSPAMARRLRAPRDLLAQTLLHDEHEPRIPEQVDWPRWFAAQEAAHKAARQVAHPPAALRQGLRFSHSYLTLDAAAAGQGVAVASDVLAADAVRQGLLAVAPGTGVRGPYRYWLLTTRAAAARPQVGAFCDWLRAQARAFARTGRALAT